MDIAALATSMKQVELSNNISVAVARKSMDAMKQQGDAAVELLKAAAETAPGGSGGASPDGVGAAIDVRG
jgi:hypothetical protein